MPEICNREVFLNADRRNRGSISPPSPLGFHAEPSGERNCAAQSGDFFVAAASPISETTLKSIVLQDTFQDAYGSRGIFCVRPLQLFLTRDYSSLREL